MAKPRKPKNLKLPKKPRNHSIVSMENYLKRRRDVESANNKKQADYKRDMQKYEVLARRVRNS